MIGVADKRPAHGAVRRAVATGATTRPSACSGCGGAFAVSAHHRDYARPLDVEWLCSACHAAEHSGRESVALAPTDLARWMLANSKSAADMARGTGIRASLCALMMRGASTVSAHAVERVREWTGGAVVLAEVHAPSRRTRPKRQPTGLGRRLKAIREHNGLSQADFARSIPCDPRMAWRWESDGVQPSPEWVATLATALGVDAGWLLTGEGKAPRWFRKEAA